MKFDVSWSERFAFYAVVEANSEEEARQYVKDNHGDLQDLSEAEYVELVRESIEVEPLVNEVELQEETV